MMTRAERQSRYARELETERDDLRRERDSLQRELARVIAQRDELRRVIGDVRQYAREEANRATAAGFRLLGEQLQGPQVGVKVHSDGIGTPAPSGPIHLAAHLADPGDPSHTG